MTTPDDIVRDLDDTFPHHKVCLSLKDVPQDIALPRSWENFGLRPDVAPVFPAGWSSFSNEFPSTIALFNDCLLGTALLLGGEVELAYIFHDGDGLYYYVGGKPVEGEAKETFEFKHLPRRLQDFYREVHDGYTFFPARSMGPQRLGDQSRVSETFHLAVDLTCTNAAVDFGQILDHPACLTLWLGDTPVRYVHGAVSSFVQGETGFRRTRYSAVVEPRLARLKLSSDWRIFQSLSVPQITEAALKAHSLTLDYEQRSTTEHQAREYCVQAGDTDYHFVERIMREEGFFYSFRHSAEGHQLVHSDRLFIHGRMGDEPVQYNPTPGGDQPQPALRRFAYTENVRTARQTQRDYTFHNPRYTHQHSRDGQDLEHQGRRYERYDYPARAKFDEAGRPFAQNRLRGHRRDARIALVEGDDPRLQPGISFTLAGHPRDDMNRGWRPVRIVHRGTQHTSQAEESADARVLPRYHGRF